MRHAQTKTTFFIALLLITAVQLTSAQTNCSYESLKGEWKETLSVPGVPNNLDSLKTAASESKRNLGLWNFMADKRYTYGHALQRSKYKKKGPYLFDADACQIILGSKINARERANLEILFVDDRFLIYKSDNNPKGYFTHVLVRYAKRSRTR